VCGGGVRKSSDFAACALALSLSHYPLVGRKVWEAFDKR